MTEFAYNNVKNVSTSHTAFKFYYGYHSKICYKQDINPRFILWSADKVATALHKPISVYRDNFQYVQEFEKRFHNQHIQLQSYTLGQKVWLNAKYIQTKQKRKLEAKVFEPFIVLNLARKQAYKLE